MIRVKKEKSIILHNKFVSIEVEGHANYDCYGKDIVCAGVSALYQTLLLTLEKHMVNGVASKGCKEKQIVVIRSPSSDIELLIDSFFIGVSAIADKYPDYVQVN